ncbi:MAG UNVERIFIED_CONTAM: hypothetical protein LVR18_23270 [Planctomycetaceae bacterium]
MCCLAAGPEVPDFNRDIRPLLRDHCVKCHGPLQQQGKLNLSLPAPIARGGEGGAVIVPGHPENSRLWQLVERDEMPEGKPLSADEKDLLRRWIVAGAPGLPQPGDLIAADDGHWAFQKLSPPKTPALKLETRIRNTLDTHVAGAAGSGRPDNERRCQSRDADSSRSAGPDRSAAID